MFLIFILLSIWLCRQPEKPSWYETGSPLSMLMLIFELEARGKGLR